MKKVVLAGICCLLSIVLLAGCSPYKEEELTDFISKQAQSYVEEKFDYNFSNGTLICDVKEEEANDGIYKIYVEGTFKCEEVGWSSNYTIYRNQVIMSYEGHVLYADGEFSIDKDFYFVEKSKQPVIFAD